MDKQKLIDIMGMQRLCIFTEKYFGTKDPNIKEQYLMAINTVMETMSTEAKQEYINILKEFSEKLDLLIVCPN